MPATNQTTNNLDTEFSSSEKKKYRRAKIRAVRRHERAVEAHDLEVQAAENAVYAIMFHYLNHELDRAGYESDSDDSEFDEPMKTTLELTREKYRDGFRVKFVETFLDYLHLKIKIAELTKDINRMKRIGENPVRPVNRLARLKEEFVDLRHTLIECNTDLYDALTDDNINTDEFNNFELTYFEANRALVSVSNTPVEVA